MFIIIIITIILHQSGFDRPVSASSNSLFIGLPSHLRPFCPQFIIIFATVLLFILVTYRGQFDLYLLSLSSAGSQLFQNSFIPF
jgi:hypothetical protein